MTSVVFVSPELETVLKTQPAYVLRMKSGDYCGVTEAARDYAVELVTQGRANFCNRRGKQYGIPIRLHWKP